MCEVHDRVEGGGLDCWPDRALQAALLGIEASRGRADAAQALVLAELVRRGRAPEAMFGSKVSSRDAQRRTKTAIALSDGSLPGAAVKFGIGKTFRSAAPNGLANWVRMPFGTGVHEKSKELGVQTWPMVPVWLMGVDDWLKFPARSTKARVSCALRQPGSRAPSCILAAASSSFPATYMPTAPIAAASTSGGSPARPRRPTKDASGTRDCRFAPSRENSSCFATRLPKLVRD